jgi:hypothetical protein
MNQSTTNEPQKPVPGPKTTPVESELRQFAKLLDDFFGNTPV